MVYKDFYFDEFELKAIELLSKKMNKDRDTLINELINKDTSKTDTERVKVKLTEDNYNLLKKSKNGTQRVKQALKNTLKEHGYINLENE